MHSLQGQEMEINSAIVQLGNSGILRVCREVRQSGRDKRFLADYSLNTLSESAMDKQTYLKITGVALLGYKCTSWNVKEIRPIPVQQPQKRIRGPCLVNQMVDLTFGDDIFADGFDARGLLRSRLFDAGIEKMADDNITLRGYTTPGGKLSSFDVDKYWVPIFHVGKSVRVTCLHNDPVLLYTSIKISVT
jgi:hypothetical protein